MIKKRTFFLLFIHQQITLLGYIFFSNCKMYFMEDEKLARMIAFENNHYKESPVKHCEHRGNKSDIIDSRLEYIDPTPNIHSLFVNFDKRFFWNSLGMVEVKWSQKMTTCAGICYYHGKNGLCSISLSAPLLSLRPRKDLVETLLHEMIHAYLFVTQNRNDREDHGPEFHKHMHRINKEAGTKISVYHTFHDEVEYYQKHIWRCDGPCQHRKPFFGLVKRASNRAPGPNDFWWERHSKECGGTFTKISGPEETKRSRKSKKDSKEPSKDKVSPNTKDIRSFFTPVASNSSSDNASKTNGTSNVVTFKDLNNDKKKPTSGMSGMTANKGSGTLVITQHKGKGKTEPTQTEKKEPKAEKQPSPKKNSSCPTNCTCKKCSDEARKVKEKVRNIWADKFSPNSTYVVSNKVTEKVNKENSPKIKKLNCPICGKGFPENEIEKHVDRCLENTSSDNKTNSNLDNGTAKNVVDIKIENSNSVIDCPVCNKKIVQSQLKEHLESCLNCSFENEPDDFFEENDEIECKSVPCPCCMKWLPEEQMDAHVDECLTMVALKNGLLDS